MNFDEWWESEKKANGGALIGADYRHWAHRGFMAAKLDVPEANCGNMTPGPLPRVKACPFAVFDEHGEGADDRVQDYAAALVAAERERLEEQIDQLRQCLKTCAESAWREGVADERERWQAAVRTVLADWNKWDDVTAREIQRRALGPNAMVNCPPWRVSST